MNLYMIKLGKAWHAIKRDGFFRAMRRISSAIMTTLRPVGSGDILFISGGVGDSALHRTTHIAEELKFNGFKCSITVQDNPLLVGYVNRFSIFIFHRTLYTERIAKMIMEIKKQNKTIIFETDDLVYDTKYLKHMDYYEKMNALERKLYDNGVGGKILRDDYVDVATTTTKFLAQKLCDEGKNVFIVPNKLSVEDVQNAENAFESYRTFKGTVEDNQKNIIKLGYFSGTISHNKDFATITSALVKIMEKYDNVNLLLVGPLDVEHELVQKFGNRIEQLSYVPRKKHFANVAQCDINLAPLEYNNPFCEAKSELKFFESGAVKVPIVAVDNETYQDAIKDGRDGFLAGDTNEWVDKLSQLIEDRNLWLQMGLKAYQKTIKDYTTKNAQNKEYYEYLKSTL